LVVIAKFISLRQVDEAIRALRASGFSPELIDYPSGGDEKVRRLGDYRLAVPEPESDDALSILSELYADAPIHEGGGGATTTLSAAAVVLTPPPGADAPWLSLRRKSSTLSELLGAALVPLAIVAALAVAGLVLRAIYNLVVYGSFF
jgi:hypothetical protein